MLGAADNATSEEVIEEMSLAGTGPEGGEFDDWWM